MLPTFQMPAKKTILGQKDAARIGIVLQLARRFRKDAVVRIDGTKYRLVTVDPFSVDADQLPEYLKKRVTTLHK